MSELAVRFETTNSGEFKLLELPPELCRIIEDATTRPLRLLIHGTPEDDAVICTEDKTYAVRTVVLSNTVMVASSSTHERNTVLVQDEIHGLLEMAPCLPRLHRVHEMLAGLEIGEDSVLDGDVDGEEEEGDMNNARNKLRAKENNITYAELRNRIQASDTELRTGLAEKHILQLRGCLYPISSSYLSKILELLLNTLVSLSLRLQDAPAEELALELEQEHEIKREVTTQVMSWFGLLDGDSWKMDVPIVLAQIGLGILGAYEHETLTVDAFLDKWAETVGDAFVAELKLELIAGNYIISPGVSSLDKERIMYYPRSALSLDPAARLGQLFATRSRWRAEDIEPFLTDIAIDSKERDRLLLKYARAITDNGVWFTARAKYNG